MKLLLEIRLHIISNLANTMTNSVSYFRVWIFRVFHNSINNRLHFFTSIQIFPNLW